VARDKETLDQESISGQASSELLQDYVLHAPPHGQEVRGEAPGPWGKGAALHALPAHLGFYQLLAQNFLSLLDTAPNIAVTLAQVDRRLLDRASLIYSLQHLGQPETERIVAPGLQPDLDAGQ